MEAMVTEGLQEMSIEREKAKERQRKTRIEKENWRHIFHWII